MPPLRERIGQDGFEPRWAEIRLVAAAILAQLPAEERENAAEDE
jgi:hypothetical protein